MKGYAEGMKNKLYKVLSKNGNRKLPNTTAIFNMASATNCPSMKKGLCKAVVAGAHCYAMKAERLYPSVLPYRKLQEKYWLSVTAEEFTKDFIEINASKRNKFNALRLNEAGDFHDQDCVAKADTIAGILKSDGVTTYVYTSRDDLDYSKVKNLIVNGSGFKKAGITNVFKIVKDEKDMPKGFTMCNADCSTCTKCLHKGSNIAVRKH